MFVNSNVPKFRQREMENLKNRGPTPELVKIYKRWEHEARIQQMQRAAEHADNNTNP